jgi:hypothetical protein
MICAMERQRDGEVAGWRWGMERLHEGAYVREAARLARQFDEGRRMTGARRSLCLHNSLLLLDPALSQRTSTRIKCCSVLDHAISPCLLTLFVQYGLILKVYACILK